MSEAAQRLTDQELAALTKRLNARPVPRDASAMAQWKVVDIAPHRRQPLGLAPIVDDIADEPKRDVAGNGLRTYDYPGATKAAEEIVADSVAMLSEEQLAAGVSWRQLFEYGIQTAIEASLDGDDLVFGRVRELKAEVAVMRNEFRDLKLAHGALKNENQALRLILENLRITQRGERGIDGDRGPPGRDGVQGPIGPKGDRGEAGPRGLPTPKIVAWETDDVRFTATPCLANGTRAATLPLKELLV